MDKKYDLTVKEVSKIVGCHRNTLLRYEKDGHISPMRDNNNYRRYSLQQALELKTIFDSRKPANEL
jgi:DNA-binding transcriptional MerR regulator